MSALRHRRKSSYRTPPPPPKAPTQPYERFGFTWCTCGLLLKTADCHEGEVRCENGHSWQLKVAAT